MKSHIRKFITVYIPNRRKQGIQEATDIQGIKPKICEPAFLVKPQPTVKGKGITDRQFNPYSERTTSSWDY